MRTAIRSLRTVVSAAALASAAVVNAVPAHAQNAWSQPKGLPPGALTPASDSDGPSAFVDPLGTFVLVYRTATGMQFAEFGADGSVGSPVALGQAAIPTQPADFVEAKFLPSGDGILQLRATNGARFLAYRFEDGRFAGPPVSVSGAAWSAMAVRPGEVLMAGDGVVLTIAFGQDGVLVPGALTRIVPLGEGAGQAGLAMDADGAAEVLFQAGREIRTASRSVSGTWSAQTALFSMQAPDNFFGALIAGSTESGRMLAGFVTLRGPNPTPLVAGTVREYRFITREPGMPPSAAAAWSADTLGASEAFEGNDKLKCFAGSDGSLAACLGLGKCVGSESVADVQIGVYGPADVLEGIAGAPGGSYRSDRVRLTVPSARTADRGGLAVRGRRVAYVQRLSSYAGALPCNTANPTQPSVTLSLEGVTGEFGVDLATTALASWSRGANNALIPGQVEYATVGPSRSAVDDLGNALVTAREATVDGAGVQTNQRWVYFTFGTPGEQHSHSVVSSLALDVAKGKLLDGTKAAKDGAKVKGSVTFLPSSDADFDPATETFTLRLGSSGAPAVLSIAAGDPGWKTKANAKKQTTTHTWKSAKGALPKASVSLVVRVGKPAAFAATVSKFDFAAGATTGEVQARLGLGADSGTDATDWRTSGTKRLLP